jgi:hypothetical protein
VRVKVDSVALLDIHSQLVDTVPAVKGPRGRPGKCPAKLHGDNGFDWAVTAM